MTDPAGDPTTEELLSRLRAVTDQARMAVTELGDLVTTLFRSLLAGGMNRSEAFTVTLTWLQWQLHQANQSQGGR